MEEGKVFHIEFITAGDSSNAHDGRSRMLLKVLASSAIVTVYLPFDRYRTTHCICIRRNIETVNIFDQRS